MRQPFIEAGRITNTHGVHGEVKLEVWLDSPQMLLGCRRIFLDGAEKKLLSARLQNRFVIARLEGIDDVNAAMPLKGKSFTIARVDAKLPDGGYFLQDLLGASVVEESGKPIGTLTDILERPASNIFVVEGADGTEHLIPQVPAFIRAVDPDAGLVTVQLIEGM